MLPKRTLAILGGLLVLCSLGPLGVNAEDFLDGEDPEHVLGTGIQLTELSYEDYCEPVAKAEWKFLQQPADPYLLKQWKDEVLQFSKFKNSEKQKINTNITGIPEESSVFYKTALILHPGDAALNNTDYDKLVSFIGKNRALRATTRYSDGAKNFTQEEVDFLLAHNGKEGDKLKAWTEWHKQFSSQVDEYSSVLQLLEPAASANGEPDVKSYWETLAGEPNGYESFASQWEKLNDLRIKLMDFTRRRLAKKYEVPFNNDSIPAHLVGSLIGNDWTQLAFDVVPYPDVIFEIRKKLWEKKLMGKYLYKSASALGKIFLGQPVSSEFWNDSEFRASCPTKLVNFCKLNSMRITTCSEPSLSSYLTAHKNVGKILMHQVASVFPVLNDVNRYSVLEEAVAEFFSILAASPAWLQNVGLLDEKIGSEEAKMTSLAITALDVLPRLAYYVSADKWRLEAIEKNETDSKQFVADWWENRLQTDFTSSHSNDLPSFLSDDHIVSNKPYLPKALGIVLAFQLYEYVMMTTEVRHQRFNKTSYNKGFVRIVEDNSIHWKSLISQHMGINSISSKAMINYFGELDYYLENYEEPEKPYDLNAREVELEHLEQRYRKIANAPPTTTTTTTTTTTPKPTTTTSSTTTTTTPRPIPKDSLTLDTSGGAPRGSDIPNHFLEGDFLDPEEEEAKPKTSTGKAVWAVAAVLIATVTICIIAICGRRRCNRTPKNRRYV